MALDVNGYNSTFKSFVEFAQQRVDANDSKAVKAMLLSDYDSGKPLTARRIMAVKAAIDADGTAAARSANIRLETFDDPGNKAAAIAKGYSRAELPRLARAAHFYARANNCDESAALDAITTPGSKANRLMQYGGRFLESAENFREGLRLIGSLVNLEQDKLGVPLLHTYGRSLVHDLQVSPDGKTATVTQSISAAWRCRARQCSNSTLSGKWTSRSAS